VRFDLGLSTRSNAHRRSSPTKISLPACMTRSWPRLCLEIKCNLEQQFSFGQRCAHCQVSITSNANSKQFVLQVFSKRNNRISVVPWNNESIAKFTAMQQQLQQLVNDELWPYNSDKSSAGSAMVVLDERDNKYMRATIISVQSSRCKVRLVDTGETVEVHHNHMWPLFNTHSAIFEVLPMAFDCVVIPAQTNKVHSGTAILSFKCLSQHHCRTRTGPAGHHRPRDNTGDGKRSIAAVKRSHR
jgi:hypothetical protein